ncbi:MAG: serine protease [Acidobacteria bacterium]|nr:serine protease [Acidobacteriota bacterium]
MITLLLLLMAAGQTPAQELSPADIFQRVKPSMVVIEALGGRHGDVLGSGFIVRPTGVIVTNYHVIEGARSVRVRLDSGDVFDDVGFVDGDERKDIAILKIKLANLAPVDIGDSEAVKPGEKILVIGHSKGLKNTITEGLVSGDRRAEDVPELGKAGFQILQISAPLWHGASGGVVLNMHGQVVGIPFAGLSDGQNINFAIPVHYVTPLISERVTATFSKAETESSASRAMGASYRSKEEALLLSKKLYVLCDWDPKLRVEATKYLLEWGKYEVVEVPFQAELVLRLSGTRCPVAGAMAELIDPYSTQVLWAATKDGGGSDVLAKALVKKMRRAFQVTEKAQRPIQRATREK